MHPEVQKIRKKGYLVSHAFFFCGSNDLTDSSKHLLWLRLFSSAGQWLRYTFGVCECPDQQKLVRDTVTLVYREISLKLSLLRPLQCFAHFPFEKLSCTFKAFRPSDLLTIGASLQAWVHESYVTVLLCSIENETGRI